MSETSTYSGEEKESQFLSPSSPLLRGPQSMEVGTMLVSLECYLLEAVGPWVESLAQVAGTSGNVTVDELGRCTHRTMLAEQSVRQ